MTIQVNKDALSHAHGLIRSGHVTYDERDAWSEDAPSTKQENDFIEKHGIDEYAKWHLGEDTGQAKENKGRYLFPFGDFSKVHRCAVISGESRAGQYDHASIERALKELLGEIDKKNAK